MSALQGGGERGHRVDAESAAGGHLIPISPNAASPDVAGTMTSPADGSRTTDLGPAFVCQGDGIISAPDVASTLQAQHGRGFALNAETADGQLVAFRKSARVNADPDSPETWVDDGLANTLNSFDVGDVRTTHAVVQPAIEFSHTQGLDPQASEERTPTLRSNGGGMAANVGPAVRRLTPLECERLQAWPEVDGRGWTDIPWNGKEHAPDSKRYAACGNGVTSTVAYWIAARLAEVLRDD